MGLDSWIYYSERCMDYDTDYFKTAIADERSSAFLADILCLI
jgi:hypothetical protein